MAKYAGMYGILKDKEKTRRWPRSPFPAPNYYHGMRRQERRRLKAGKIKTEKAVTFCTPPPTTLSLNALSHRQLCLNFKERQVATGDDMTITVEKTVGAEATMWRRLHRVVSVALGFSYLVNRSKNLKFMSGSPVGQLVWFICQRDHVD